MEKETTAAQTASTATESSQESPQKKSGFATIIGRPNVGKSTLMNRMIGQKIAITSYKPQTTRGKIRTIYTDDQGQIVFLDTPGIHKSNNRLGTYMLKASSSTLKEVDVILYLIEPRQKRDEEEMEILEQLRTVKRPKILVINKIDKTPKEKLLPLMAAYANDGIFSEILPVSARTGEGVDELMKTLFDKLPYGEPFYDEDMVTTETERDIAAEIIREKTLRLLQEEVPHGIAVTIERMKERTTKAGEPICDIDASIICEKNSHKGIVIGKKGAMLQKIGTAARIDIENMLQCKANLKLFVKVREGWKDDDNQLRLYGYDVRKI